MGSGTQRGGRAARAARTIALVVAGTCAAGCFAGYDSRWGAEARSQKLVARHATPDELRATPSEAPTSKLRVMTVRAYTSDRYSSEVGDENRQITRLIENANDILETTLDLQLDLVEIKRWSTSNDDLEQLLTELTNLDAAQDVDWVVGFVGKPAAIEVDFKRLGKAQLPGKHLVMRAMNDAAEYDAIRKNLDELDEGDRRELYRKRIAHKETTIFLHELGHTLGTPHARDQATIMHAVYNRKVARFSPEAAQLMRMSLDRRVEPKSMTDVELAKTLVEHLEQTGHTWVEADREQLLSQLRPQAASMADQRPESFATDAHWRALTAAERTRFHQVLDLDASGQPEQALEQARPLYESHRAGYEIQDLRCRLAMRIGGDPEAMKAHCAEFNRLEAARR